MLSIIVTFLNQAGFKFAVSDPSKGLNKVLYIDPWLNTSPYAPDSEKSPTKADLILVTHAHFEHLGDAPAMSTNTSAPIVCLRELANSLKANGYTVEPMNKGGTIDYGWVSITMVTADHSGGVRNGGDYVGAPVGYVIDFKNGAPPVYHTGDTNYFSEMEIICDLYNPKVGLINIGGGFTMGPREAAYAVNNLLYCIDTVVPMHYGTFPFLTGTPQEFTYYLNQRLQGNYRSQSRKVSVNVINPGQSVSLFSLV